jgi:multiple sugar transport system permease protein
MLMAMTVLTVVPVLVLFFVAQRTFIQGVKLSGMKE